jgi:hypothetical protein
MCDLLMQYIENDIYMQVNLLAGIVHPLTRITHPLTRIVHPLAGIASPAQVAFAPALAPTHPRTHPHAPAPTPTHPCPHPPRWHHAPPSLTLHAPLPTLCTLSLACAPSMAPHAPSLASHLRCPKVQGLRWLNKGTCCVVGTCAMPYSETPCYFER